MEINQFSPQLIKTRRNKRTSIYLAGNSIIKKGDTKTICYEKRILTKLSALHFPVPEVIGFYEHGNEACLIETFLGTTHFGESFANDSTIKGKIDEQTLSEWMDITFKYAIAQLATQQIQSVWTDFSNLIAIPLILHELPHHSAFLQKLVTKIKKRLITLPFVFTHGDFNPHNLFSAGIIDFEDCSFGPIGYDLISNLIHTYFFPSEKNYELIRQYQFSEIQINNYLAAVHHFYKQHLGIDLLEYLDDLIICHAIWSTAEMHSTPILKIWRYQLLLYLCTHYGKTNLMQLLASY